MRTWALSLGLIAHVAAMAPSAEAASPRNSGTTNVRNCALPPGWDAIEARKSRVVIFGEMHGTREAPAFVGAIACALATQGKSILVAVEHAAVEDAAFQAAWRLDEAHFPEALKRAGWASRDDGVGSEAMLGLLIRLHQLARHGRSIDIVAFSGAKDEAQGRRFADLPGQGPHDAAQAENIRIAAAAKPYDKVLVLVGNIHARKRPVAFGDTVFEPTAMRLGPSSSVISLDMEMAGGTAWNCQIKPGTTPRSGGPISAADIACGSYPVTGRGDLNREPFVALQGLPGTEPAPGFDGIFWLGSITASPMAVRL